MDVSEKTEDRISPEAALSTHHGHTTQKLPEDRESPDTAEPRRVSLKSDQSRIPPLTFSDGQQNEKLSLVNLRGRDTPEPSSVAMRSIRSKSESIEFRNGNPGSEVVSVQPLQQHQENVDSIFMLLEENMISFMRNEIKKLRKVLDTDDVLEEDQEVVEDDGRITRNQDAFLNITLNYLRTMKQEQLSEFLQSKTLAARCQRKLKSNLKKKFQSLFEGIAKEGKPTLLKKIYTELCITEGDNREMNDQHEVRYIEAASRKSAGSEINIQCEDIFTPLPGREEPVRTLVTKGVAGIGKTVLTQKYILDWAEDKANQDIQFIFPLTFRELNLLKDQKYSLVELLHQFFSETKQAGICRFEEFQVVFIFDGLDECRLPLDFKNNEILTDVTKPSSVDVLLTNLIQGKLLPSARLWITTRPAAANQIPPRCVDMVTEVKGFSDPQKDEYFRKRFKDEEQANRIISHIKTSRSLHIMCHIPVFCWITATVLEHVLEIGEKTELPKTLTEMYIHFLVVQTSKGNVKYRGSTETDRVWNSESKKTVCALAKLAFKHLEKGNLIFCEDDLISCETDAKAASVYSGLITEVFREDHGLDKDKAFSFVHLSIQEFLAALHVFVTYINTGVDVVRTKHMHFQRKSKCKYLYYAAVDKALQSPTGHLDLFVRFLLGLSLESNQTLLRSLLNKTAIKPKVNKKLVLYIKNKIRGCHSPDRSINLFHCLNELNDHSLVEEMQQYLRSGGVLKSKLSHSQWTALAFILLSSQKDLDVFELKNFATSDDGLQSLLHVVRASKTSLLSGCDLSSQSCDILATVFLSKNSNLREVDLSNNDLGDRGVQLLSAGLGSPHCKLEVLRLSGCLVTEEGCASLVLALKSNPSHLKELDLSFNNPGDTSVKQLSSWIEDPNWKLKTLNVEHCGKSRLMPSPLRCKLNFSVTAVSTDKVNAEDEQRRERSACRGIIQSLTLSGDNFCRLSLDPNTVDRNLCLFDDNKGVMVVEEKQTYPDHPDRFDSWKQLLGSDGLTGRCYWELRWIGRVNVGVAYKGIRRSGDSDDCCLGWNDQSWSLICTPQGYTAWHNNTATDIDTPQPSDSNRVAVYLDWPAGTVSFFCFNISSNRQILLHTFHCRFTEPLYPAFGFGRMHDFGASSIPGSFHLLHLEK